MCADESVDVIYVSPVDLDKDTLEYYIKLLSMRQLDEDTPSSEDEDTPKRSFDRERLHVVIPENLEAFRSCRMSLSTVLLYSPKGLARIRRLVAGRPAYIVSGLVSMDDIALADTLGRFRPTSCFTILHHSTSRRNTNQLTLSEQQTL